MSNTLPTNPPVDPRSAAGTPTEELPSGTLVRYWPGAREGAGTISRTRSEVWELGHGTPVVKVDGYSGGIALTHVEVLGTAEILRAAAARLRGTAKHAAPGPWHASPVWSPDSSSTSGVYSHAYPTGSVESEVVASGRIKPGYGGTRNPHNAEWIAMVSPVIAGPLAAWLEAGARIADQFSSYGGADSLSADRSLAVAQALLGVS